MNNYCFCEDPICLSICLSIYLSIYVSMYLSVYVYINDLNHAMFCKVRHLADDTNLVHFSKSINKLKKYINIDIKYFN